MADIPALNNDGSAFVAYLESEGSERDSVTVHEDGTIKVFGAVSGEEALGMLQQAIYRLQEYMQRRPLPSLILTTDYPVPDHSHESTYGSANTDDIPF
jgi:hypothetical protein